MGAGRDDHAVALLESPFRVAGRWIDDLHGILRVRPHQAVLNGPTGSAGSGTRVGDGGKPDCGRIPGSRRPRPPGIWRDIESGWSPMASLTASRCLGTYVGGREGLRTS